MNNKQIKHSHIYSPEEQDEIIAFVKQNGDTPETVTAMRRKFKMSDTTSYYYRRKAFGYRRGQKLPVQIMVSPETAALLDAAIGSGKAKERRDAAEHAIKKIWGGENKQSK